MNAKPPREKGSQKEHERVCSAKEEYQRMSERGTALINSRRRCDEEVTGCVEGRSGMEQLVLREKLAKTQDIYINNTNDKYFGEATRAKFAITA